MRSRVGFGRLRSLLPERLKRRLRALLGLPNMEGSLRLMRRNGFNPRLALDVGAYSGEWTRLCKRVFPAARVLMVEPRSTSRDALAAVALELDGVDLAPPVLLGECERGDVPFFERETASSVLRESVKRERPAEYLRMTTVDTLGAGTAFARPDLIKLDVQGYELKVLEGASRALAAAEVVLAEVNLMQIYEGAPLFHEVAGRMGDWGFQVYDVCSFYRRPFDGAVWQLDVIFVRTGSPLLSSLAWRSGDPSPSLPLQPYRPQPKPSLE